MTHSPEPAEIVSRLSDKPGYPLLTSLLQLSEICVKRGDWSGHDVSGLIDRLRSLTVRDSTQHRQATTIEARARPLLVGLLSRCGTLPEGPARQLIFAHDVMALIKNAAYDLRQPQDLDAFVSCLTEMGQMLDRLQDVPTIVDLLLEIADWLHALQPRPTRWRRRTAQAVNGAFIKVAENAPPAECRRLIAGLLDLDMQMARLAIAACAEQLRPIPPWLNDLTAVMPHDVHKRLRGVMKGNAREGSARPFPELYEAALSRVNDH